MDRRTGFYRGRRFPSQRAVEAPPGLEPSLHEDGLLQSVRRAGRDGCKLGDGISVSTAIRLELRGLVTITRGETQRVVARGPLTEGLNR